MIHQPYKFLRSLALLGLIFTLSACGSWNFFDEPEQKTACPEHLILKNASMAASDDTATPDWQVKVTRLGGDCVIQNKKLSMTLGVRLDAARKTLETPFPKDLEYFVAILDSADAVVSKQIMSVAPDFAKDALTTPQVDLVDMNFADDASNYKVFVGFEPKNKE